MGDRGYTACWTALLVAGLLLEAHALRHRPCQRATLCGAVLWPLIGRRYRARWWAAAAILGRLGVHLLAEGATS